MKHLLARLSIVVGLSLSTSVDAVDINDIFNTYSQGAAGTFDTSQGRYWTGGSFQGRIPQQNVEFGRFSPPSISGSCSGVDIFAGSFGLISGDELVQVARGIAQGAAPYFFGLAMQSICPSCKNLMGEISATVDELNRFGQNSCQQAWDRIGESSGINDNIRSWAGSVGKLKDSEEGLDGGYLEKFRTALSGKSAGDDFNNLSQESKELVNVNVLPNYIINQRPTVDLRLLNIDDKLEYAGLFMSLIGSVIVQADEAGTCAAKIGNDSGKCFSTVSVPAKYSLKKIYEGLAAGDTARRYRCTDSKCLEYSEISPDEKGIEGIFVEAIAGEDGLIERLRTKSSLSATQRKIQLISGYNFVKLARGDSVGLTKNYSTYLAKVMALDYVKGIGRSLLQAVRESSMTGAADPMLSNYQDQMGELKLNFEKQYMEFVSEIEAKLAKDAQALQSELAMIQIRRENEG